MKTVPTTAAFYNPRKRPVQNVPEIDHPCLKHHAPLTFDHCLERTEEIGHDVFCRILRTIFAFLEEFNNINQRRLALLPIDRGNRLPPYKANSL